VSGIVYIVSESEYRVLRLMIEKGFSTGSIRQASHILGIDKSSLASIFMLLRDKGLVDIKEVSIKKPKLTDKGLDVLSKGFPEEKLINILIESGEASIADLSRSLGPETSIAIGQARRKGLVIIEKGLVKLNVSAGEALESINSLKKALEDCSRGVNPGEPYYSELRDRGLIAEIEERDLYIEVRGDLRSIIETVRVEASRLTHSMLKSGTWRMYKFRAYDVTLEPPEILPARLHFLREFIEVVRDIFKEMGFKEVTGPIVELELFNFDILFQAQDHPAREIHDSLWVKAEPADLRGYMDLIDRVSRVHESNWGYRWSPDIAARLMLRSQTTAVSARVIVSRPKPPIRFYTIGRVYRHDSVDATHLPEFHQLDGIEGYPGYTFRDLLGTLRDISERLGLEVKFKPAYFPFTEPSVEGYVRLPNGRWLELYGAGLFRPEVLEMADVDYPIGAWGFGIERLAAAYYNIQDIRLLYTTNIEMIRRFNVKGWV